LLNLPGEGGRTAARTCAAPSPNLRTAAVADLAGPEPEIVVIARHGMTIGSHTTACKSQNACIVA
jgi:hypothetical protein